MIGQIDGYYIAAQIRLMRQVHKGTILILEGPTDSRVFDRLIDKDRCDIEVAFGKPNALSALDLLEEDGFLGVVAVVDADFDRVLTKNYSLHNLCLSDFHDLDLTVFSSAAFDRYIAEHADDELLKSEFGSDCSALRLRLLDAALPFAFCRLVSERLSLRLYFADLDHGLFVDVNDLSVLQDRLFSALISRSATTCTEERLANLVAAEGSRDQDALQLCNGHDVAAVLGIALRKLIGRKKVPQTWTKEIEAGLRLAFDWEAFISTGLFACLCVWEGNNRPYKIFRQAGQMGVV